MLVNAHVKTGAHIPFRRLMDPQQKNPQHVFKVPAPVKVQPKLLQPRLYEGGYVEAIKHMYSRIIDEVHHAACLCPTKEKKMFLYNAALVEAERHIEFFKALIAEIDQYEVTDSKSCAEVERMTHKEMKASPAAI